MKKPESHVDHLSASTICIDRFTILQATSTLREALAEMTVLENTASLLVMQDREILGVLSVEAAIAYLCAGRLSELDAGILPAALHQRLEERLSDIPLGKAVCIEPATGLAEMLQLAHKQVGEWLLVVDPQSRQPIGQVLYNTLFLSAAGLALDDNALIHP
ncbi:MAG: hypothetical protein KKI09_12590 [Spirochaetes bacterium]|nr:hypothetical protein [Spirochaetota bacterium]MBU0956260.1 hypothetical protein [Spirochaetota bacterium]